MLGDGSRRPVIGTISMDALAVRLDGPLEPGTPVTLIGDGLLIEEHAAQLGTIGYELYLVGSTPLNTATCASRLTEE